MTSGRSFPEGFSLTAAFGHVDDTHYCCMFSFLFSFSFRVELSDGSRFFLVVLDRCLLKLSAVFSNGLFHGFVPLFPPIEDHRSFVPPPSFFIDTDFPHFFFLAGIFPEF